MNNKKNEKNKDNLLEGKQKQSRPFLKGKTYPSQNLNKYPPDNEDYLDSNISHQKKNLRSYLDIFHRPSFRNLNRNIQANYDLNTPFISEQEEKETDKKYDYPVNIFKRLVYTWTRKVLSASNSKPNLEISDLGFEFGFYFHYYLLRMILYLILIYLLSLLKLYFLYF